MAKQSQKQQQKSSEEKTQNQTSIESQTTATEEEAAATAPGDEQGTVAGQQTAREGDSLTEARAENDELKDSEQSDDIKRGPATHWQSTPYRAGVSAPQNARILKQDEDVTFDGEQIGNMVVVKEDVYREVYPYNSKRPSYVLVYSKGTQIPANTLAARQSGNVTDEDEANK